MKSRIVCLLLTSALLFCVCFPAEGADVDPKKIRELIARGKKFLYSKQQKDGSWKKTSKSHYPTGTTTMACYALLACDESVQNPKLEKALDWLAKHKTNYTYSQGIRCYVWKLAAAQNRRKYNQELIKDSIRLYNGGHGGGYSYTVPWDNPNTPHGKGRHKFLHNSTAQYGVLGVWAGTAANALETSSAYWTNVEKWWTTGQRSDGGWAYEHNKGGSRPSMTTAGIASLFLCFDHLNRDRFVNCGAGQLPASITRGLAYMSKHAEKSIRDHKSAPHGLYTYHLYGCERVGLAAGYKYFGKCDWYKTGVDKIASLMGKNGAIVEPHEETNDGVVPTSFALVFLRRGLYPVLFNKLQFSGDWNNRPRDLANATDWFSDTFEDPVRWQVTNLITSARDLHDSQFLYISAEKKPAFSEQEINIMRAYVYQGGTIVSVTECEGESFKTGIREIYKKMFPGYDLKECSADHPIYSSYEKLEGKPPMHILSNGVRPLVVHSDYDLAKSWQIRATATRKKDFLIIPNMVRYVVGRKTDLRSRGEWYWPLPNSKAADSIAVARLKHTSNWNPEPLAWQRFSNILSHKEGKTLKLSSINIGDLASSGCTVASLTGTGELKMSEGEISAIKKWVSRGGRLVIDAANSSEPFYASVKSALESGFGSKFRPLTVSDEIYTLSGKAIGKIHYRKASMKSSGASGVPKLEILRVGGKSSILLSWQDITSGLVGYPSGAAKGYECDSAYNLMRNIVLTASSEGFTSAPVLKPKDPVVTKPAETKTTPPPSSSIKKALLKQLLNDGTLTKQEYRAKVLELPEYKDKAAKLEQARKAGLLDRGEYERKIDELIK